jgi:hypothetical protein
MAANAGSRIARDGQPNVKRVSRWARRGSWKPGTTTLPGCGAPVAITVTSCERRNASTKRAAVTMPPPRPFSYVSVTKPMRIRFPFSQTR